MPNPSADAFLDCIMKRSKYDTLIHMGTVFLMTIVAPIVITVYATNGSGMDEDKVIALIGTQMLENLIFNFIIFSIILALHKHHMRDIMWMDALIGYASSYGKDVSGMRAVRQRSTDDRLPAVVTAFRVYIVILTAVTVIQGVMVSVRGMDVDTCRSLVMTYSLIMLILLCISTAYQFKKLRKYNSLQFEFTRLFSKSMSCELGSIPSMTNRIWTKHVWPHVFLMVITAGFYAMPFSLFVIHSMNAHITSQHRYEGKLLRLMMEKEGATGITRTEQEDNDSTWSKILNFFR